MTQDEPRIARLLAELSLEEKVALCAGSGPWHTTPVPRLGIPALKVSDGPNGVRGNGISGASAACFPVGAALAATWNVDLIRRVGDALGQEAQSKGAGLVLGPTVNLHRHPLAGRNFECYSEDPHLSARIAVAFIEGVQATGVGACIKHFVGNDSEFERHSISSEIAEAPLRELYLPPFEAAVREARVLAVMSAYNRINGTYASSHEGLLRGVLKDEWGFRGLVISDWGAATETVANANGGLDLEMPGPPRAMGERLLAAVRSGEVEEARVDDKARRLLGILSACGLLDNDQPEADERAENRPEHRALARRVAAESIVLVRNRGVLPLDPRRIQRLALIGPNAERAQIQGGGSSIVRAHYEIHPLAALRECLGEDVEILHEPGCRIDKTLPAIDPASLRPAGGEDRPGLLLEYWNGEIAEGPAVETRIVRRCRAFWMGEFSPRVDARNFSARYSGAFTAETGGLYDFSLQSAGGSRLFIDDALLIDNTRDQEPGDAFFGNGSAERRAQIQLEEGESYALRVEFQSDPNLTSAGLQFGALPPQPADGIERAVAAAQAADAVVLVLGTNGEWETEGNDRRDMALPGRQDELAERVLAARPDAVVALNVGSPVTVDWIEACGALLQISFGGQELGHALADILLGEINPSGRVPTTWPVRLEDSPAFPHYPGENGRVEYGEGRLMGYRGYERRGVEPRIPFGHGLSYTEFAYDELQVPESARAGEEVEVSVRVTNAGNRAGQEVVQVYVREPGAGAERPDKELRAFAKIDLNVGQAESIRLRLPARAFEHWDENAGAWRAEPGPREIVVGASSADLRVRAPLEILGSN
jgi:beta-glucosidase